MTGGLRKTRPRAGAAGVSAAGYSLSPQRGFYLLLCVCGQRARPRPHRFCPETHVRPARMYLSCFMYRSQNEHMR